MEEAFSQSSREASEQRRKRPQRTMATREKTTREERGKTQRQLPNEASKGEAPVNQGHATVEGKLMRSSNREREEEERERLSFFPIMFFRS